MLGYKTRFVPQTLASEITELYHTSRIALSNKPHTRYHRMLWTVDEIMKAHPEITCSHTGVYKDVECITEVF